MSSRIKSGLNCRAWLNACTPLLATMNSQPNPARRYCTSSTKSSSSSTIKIRGTIWDNLPRLAPGSMTVRLKSGYEMETRRFVFFHLLAKSARGLAHSTTLRVFQESLRRAQRLGLRSALHRFFAFRLPVKQHRTRFSRGSPKNLFAAGRCGINPRDMPTHQGSIRLFQLFGIDVYLHWSWFFVACVRNPDPGEPLFLHPVERAGISHVVFDRAHARVWPFARLPAGGRTGKSNRALAARRRGVCLPAATAGRDALEHRRRTAGERGAFPRAFNHLVAGLFGRLDGNRSERLCLRR